MKKILVTLLKWLNQKIQKHKKNQKDASTAADVFSLPHDQLGQLVESGTIQEVPEEYTKEIAATATDQAIVGAQYKGKRMLSHLVLNHKFFSTINQN